MSRFSNWRWNTLEGLPSSIVEYGLLFVLLIFLTVAELFLSSVVQVLGDVSPYYVAPRIYGTIVYSILGMAVLGIGYLAYCHSYDRDVRLDDSERLRLVLATFLLLIGVVYALVGTVNVSNTVTLLFGTFVTAILGIGVSVVYLRVRDTDIRLGPPEGSLSTVIVIAVLVPVSVVVILSLVIYQGTVNSSQWLLHGQYTRPISLVHLIQNTLFASVFTAFGASFLYYGAIQETLRKYSTPTGAIAGTTVLVGCFRWLTEQMLSIDGIALPFSVAAAVLLVIIATAFAVRFWRTLALTVDNYISNVTIAAVFGVLLVALFVSGWYFLLGSLNPTFVGYTIGYTLVAAIAAVTYEHTRSIWVSVLAIGMFHVTINLVAYVQFLLSTRPA